MWIAVVVAVAPAAVPARTTLIKVRSEAEIRNDLFRRVAFPSCSLRNRSVAQIIESKLPKTTAGPQVISDFVARFVDDLANAIAKHEKTRANIARAARDEWQYDDEPKARTQIVLVLERYLSLLNASNPGSWARLLIAGTGGKASVYRRRIGLSTANPKEDGYLTNPAFAHIVRAMLGVVLPRPHRVARVGSPVEDFVKRMHQYNGPSYLDQGGGKTHRYLASLMREHGNRPWSKVKPSLLSLIGDLSVLISEYVEHYEAAKIADARGLHWSKQVKIRAQLVNRVVEELELVGLGRSTATRIARGMVKGSDRWVDLEWIAQTPSLLQDPTFAQLVEVTRYIPGLLQRKLVIKR